jgi:hypothetical protein
MFTARISFPLEGRDPEDVAEAGYDILAVWLKNGQIVGDDWPFVTSGSSLDVYVTIPEPGALQPEHDNRYAAAALRDLGERGLDDGLRRGLAPRPYLGEQRPFMGAQPPCEGARRPWMGAQPIRMGAWPPWMCARSPCMGDWPPSMGGVPPCMGAVPGLAVKVSAVRLPEKGVLYAYASCNGNRRGWQGRR